MKPQTKQVDETRNHLITGSGEEADCSPFSTAENCDSCVRRNGTHTAVSASTVYDRRDGQTSDGLALMLRRVEELRAPCSIVMTKQFSPILNIHAVQFLRLPRIVVDLTFQVSVKHCAACFVGVIINPIVPLNVH